MSYKYVVLTTKTEAMDLWWLLALHAGDEGSIPGRGRAKSFKQEQTTPLPNSRQQMHDNF